MVCDVQEENWAHHADERHLRIPFCTAQLEGYTDAAVYAASCACFYDGGAGIGSSSDTKFLGQ